MRLRQKAGIVMFGLGLSTLAANAEFAPKLASHEPTITTTTEALGQVVTSTTMSTSTTTTSRPPRSTTTSTTAPAGPEVEAMQATVSQDLQPALHDAGIDTLTIAPNGVAGMTSIVVSSSEDPSCAGLFNATSDADTGSLTISFNLFGDPNLLIDPVQANNGDFNAVGHADPGTEHELGIPELIPGDATSIQTTTTFITEALSRACASYPAFKAYQQSEQEFKAQHSLSTTTTTTLP